LLSGEALAHNGGMRARRSLCALAPLIVLGFVGTACAGASSEQASASTTTPAGGRVWSIVALGDSVPRGTNCDCRPYPPLTADELTASAGRTVAATNDSVAGFTTASVLKQLRENKNVIAHVRAARAVEIEVGANDVPYSKSCGTEAACYAPRIPEMEKNLTSIVRRVEALAAGHRTLVVLLDYWSVWLGGQYAAAKGDAYVAAAMTVTDQVNDAIKSVASRSRSAYVDLRAAFKGPNYAYDETHYLASDGDHPNAQGHKQIAAATKTVIEKALHL